MSDRKFIRILMIIILIGIMITVAHSYNGSSVCCRKCILLHNDHMPPCK